MISQHYYYRIFLQLSIIFVVFGSSLLVQSAKISQQNSTSIQKQCNLQRKFQTDLIMQRFVTFGPNGRKFPETNEQLNNYCDECNRLISKVEKYYEQCADGYNKNMAKISLYSLRHIMRTFCRSNNNSGNGNGKKKQTNQQRKSAKKLKRLMALTPCLNRHRLNITCLDRFAERSWPLVDAPIGNEKISYICW